MSTVEHPGTQFQIIQFSKFSRDLHESNVTAHLVLSERLFPTVGAPGAVKLKAFLDIASYAICISYILFVFR